MRVIYIGALLFVFSLALSSCSKNKPSPVGKWQLTDFDQRIVVSYVNGIYTDTFVYEMNNSIINYSVDGEDKQPYGLFLQMDMEDDSVRIVEVVSSIGLSSTTNRYTGKWSYNEEKVDLGVSGNSHIYNRAPNTYLGQTDFTLEKLTDEELVLGAHYRAYSDDSSDFVENNSTVTFLKYR